MDATSIVAGSERVEPEVPRLNGLSDVVATRATPAHQIFLGDEDAAVVTASAAGAALEAIEDRRGVACRVVRERRRDFSQCAIP
jgi:hypothetical protein